jgi:hypothetical protein
MRYVMAILGLLFLCPFARADQVQVVDVSAVDCPACWGTPYIPPPSLPPVDLELQLTVEPVTGTFLFPGYDVTLTATVDEILSLSGTLNGNPVSLAPPGRGDGNWLYENTFGLGWVCFTSSGEDFCMGNDNANNLLTNYSEGTFEPITWDAADPVATPEPMTLLLAGTGIVVVFLGFRRHSRRKFRDAPITPRSLVQI